MGVLKRQSCRPLYKCWVENTEEEIDVGRNLRALHRRNGRHDVRGFLTRSEQNSPEEHCSSQWSVNAR